MVSCVGSHKLEFDLRRREGSLCLFLLHNAEEESLVPLLDLGSEFVVACPLLSSPLANIRFR